MACMPNPRSSFAHSSLPCFALLVMAFHHPSPIPCTHLTSLNCATNGRVWPPSPVRIVLRTNPSPPLRWRYSQSTAPRQYGHASRSRASCNYYAPGTLSASSPSCGDSPKRLPCGRTTSIWPMAAKRTIIRCSCASQNGRA